MNVDENLHPAKAFVHTRGPRREQQGIVVDATVSSQVDADWFDPDYWLRHGSLQLQPGGRGGVAVVDTPVGECVLRHYRRGGAVARLLDDRYLWAGAERTRCLAEFRLLQHMVHRQLPGPEPIAAAWRRSGAFYRADLMTRRIAGARTLAEQLAADGVSSELATEVGALVARFHREDVWHADLNAHNVLLGARGLYLIDFDRGRLRAASRSWRMANLQRLRRSLCKLGAADAGDSAFEAAIWTPLLRGYESTFGA